MTSPQEFSVEDNTGSDSTTDGKANETRQAPGGTRGPLRQCHGTDVIFHGAGQTKMPGDVVSDRQIDGLRDQVVMQNLSRAHVDHTAGREANTEKPLVFWRGFFQCRVEKTGYLAKETFFAFQKTQVPARLINNVPGKIGEDDPQALGFHIETENVAVLRVQRHANPRRPRRSPVTVCSTRRFSPIIWSIRPQTRELLIWSARESCNRLEVRQRWIACNKRHAFCPPMQ